MIRFFGAFDEHVINIDFHIMPYLNFKDLIDKSLVGGSYIFQTKRYYFIEIITFFDYEDNVLFIC